MRGLRARQSILLPPPVVGALWVPLTQSKFALVDEQDRWVLGYPWHYKECRNCEYAARREDGHSLYLHRQILGLTPADSFGVDHRDGDGLNNRRTNLRLASHQQNLQNQRPRGGSSPFRGVCWDESRKKWIVTVRFGARREYLGRFNSEHEAALAYNLRARELFGEFARLNPVDNGEHS